ncbi:ABC transporter substrate-binding protein [Kineosporia babensis]
MAETVRYAAPGSPTVATDDPHGLLPGESDIVRMALTYDPLTVPGPDGEAQPRLATSWTPDEKLTTWTIELRDDAVFSDGEPVRAADALFSLRRMEEKAAENFARLRMFDLKKSSAVDENTLELVTTEPYAEVGIALAGATFVVPEGSTDFTGETPVAGSGPFVPAGGDAQTALFDRNDDWWGPQPPSQHIEVRAIPDPQARADALLAGEVDWAGAVPATAAQTLDKETAALAEIPGSTMYPLTMRTDTKPFDDPLVREAVRLALDRQQLLDTVFLGYGDLGNDLITPADVSSPDLPQREQDLAKAKELMAQAGLADGVDITLYSTTAYAGMDTAATLISEQLAEIGIRAKVELSPPDSYFVDVYGQKPFYLSYLGGIGFLDVVRVALTPGSPSNETAWEDKKWSADLATALAEPDEATRREQLGELQTRLRDEGGYAVWAVSDRLDLTAPGLSGLPQGIGFATAFVDQVKLAN